MASRPESVDYFRLPEDPEFSQGMEFCTHKDFKEKFESYCQRTGQVFFCRTFTSVQRANEKVAPSRPKFNMELAVSTATYLCVHASAYKSRSTGKRPNAKSQRKHCPAKLLLSANRYKGDKSGSLQVLRISELSVCHNHDVSPTDYAFYARNRNRLTDEQQVFVKRALNLKVKSATVKECLQQLGKEVKSQDIRNMRNRARRQVKTEKNVDMDLIKNILKFKETNEDLEESKNEKSVNSSLYQETQNKSASKLNVSAALGKPANNERIRKTPLNAASTSSNNSTLSSQPIEIENDSPPAKKPREIHIDIDVSEEESIAVRNPFIRPAIDSPEPKLTKLTTPTTEPPSSVVRNSVVDVNTPQKQKRILVVPNHQQSVMSNLSSLWKAGRLCDAFISNGVLNVKVHKMILAAVCPKVLEIMDRTSRHILPKIIFPSTVSKEGLLAFAEYMYNGVLDLDPNILSQMLAISKQLGMKDFEELCMNQLKSANTLPAILETMLNELCSTSRLHKQTSNQGNTASMERVPATTITLEKDTPTADSSLKINSSTFNNCSNTVSNLSSKDKTKTNDALMEVTNNNVSAPFCDINVNHRPHVKIENVELDEQHYEKVEHEQRFSKEFTLSNIDNFMSDNINTRHLPHIVISSPSTTSKSSHPNNTTVTKPLLTDEIWTATNKDQGNLVGNVKPANPYPTCLFTSNWANVPLHTQDIKKEYTVE